MNSNKALHSAFARISFSASSLFLSILVVSVVCMSGCEGKNEGEVTFPPRKSTFPLAMEPAPNATPAYTFEPKVAESN